METGIVKFWKTGKGFGFVTPDVGGEDLFVHVSQVRQRVELEQGDRVRYERAPNPAKVGKFVATMVELVVDPADQAHARANAVLGGRL